MQPLILEHTHTNSDICHSGDVIVRSHFDGQIICEGLLIIEKQASVSGEIHTQTAHIHGCFTGLLEAREHVIFSSGATFQGVLDAKAMLCPLDTTLIGDIRIEPSKPREIL